jgi:hypothetical protein
MVVEPSPDPGDPAALPVSRGHWGAMLCALIILVGVIVTLAFLIEYGLIP